MADTPNGDRPSLRPSLRPSHRPETLSALLDKPLTDEGKVLDALVTGLSSGESTAELFDRLHDAAAKAERVANLSFAYERVARDNRIKLLPKPRQAEFFLAAARFFGDVFGDIDAGVGFAERAHQLAPDDAVVFDQLETLLASAQQGTKLAKLYSDSAARAKDRSEKLRLLRAAIELLEAFGGTPDDVLALYRQLVEQDPEDKVALETLEKLYLSGRRFRELADLLEKSIAKESTIPVAASDEIRLRLLGLYRGELRDPTKAAPHVEVLLSREPIGPAALQAAEALIDHRPVAARIAPLLSEAYRRLGRHEDEASTLALELKLARPPRLADVHRRLAILRQDVLGDPSGALELLEPLVARDPADHDLRRRYLEVSVTFHREVEAAKLLARAISTSKDVAVRSRVGLEIATLYAKQGDVRRARATLEPLVEEAETDAARLPLVKRLVELHQDGADPKGLAQALAVVIRLDPELAGRMSAAKRLAELCDGPVDEPKLAVLAWRALLGSPRGDEALDKLEALYEKLGDDAGMIELLAERALRAKDPEKAKRFAFRAAELKAARAPDRARAIEAWSDLVRAQGPSKEVLGKLAALLEQQRDFRELSAVLTSSLSLATKEELPALHAKIAKIRLVELRDPVSALEALRAALELDPKEPSARRLAEKLLADGEHRLAAAAVLEPAYRAEGNHAGIVRILESRADLEATPSARLSLLEEACRIAEAQVGEPRRALDLAGRGLADAARSRLGDVPRWLERFRRAATRASEPSRRAELLAVAITDVPIDRAEAAELGKEAGEALVTAGEVARALDVYRRVLAFEPSSAELLRRVDELLAEQGSPEERILLYRAALERATGEHRRRELLHAIAKIQRRDLRDLRGAVETLGVLAEESPADVAVHEARVECLAELGDHPALAAELERALSFVEGERRTATMLELARRRAEAGEPERALALYRQLVASDELPAEAFKTVAALAEAASDAETLAEVLERTALRAQDEREQVASLEKLGEVRGAQLGDAKGAVAAFRKAALLSRDLDGEEARATRLFERVLDAEPDDREAARFLVDAYARAGRWAKVPSVFAVLLRADASHEPIDVLLGLEKRATEALAIDELLAMADEALARKTQDAGRRARDLMTLKARALAATPSRRAEAAAILRGLVETYAEASDVEAFRRFLEKTEGDESTFPEQRWLFAFRVEHTNDPASVLWEWASAEEQRMRDPRAAVHVLEELLNLDPSRSEARVALRRIQLARGEAEALLKELSSLRARVPAEETLDVDLEIAALLVEHLGRARDAMPLVQGALSRSPGHPEALRVARVALRRPESRRESAALLGAVAASAEGANGESLLSALLDETRGAEELGAARAGWYARLVELLAAEPAKALAVAVQAAEEMPEESSLWDAAERFARRAGDPRSVADAYSRTLSRALPEALAEVVGQRFVEFQEEWFDEPEAVLKLLERVLEISPRARWALDRIKLAYNAEARWDDLFGLYDRAIAGATDPHEQVDLLDEAALAAKDLANDSDRAVQYLERLQQVRPDPRVESMLERLYDRTGRARELISLLEKRESSVSGVELARLEARLARLRLDLGEVEEAFALIGRVLQADPEEPAAYALLERLVKVPGAPSVFPPGRSAPPGKSVPPGRKGGGAKKAKKRVDKAAPKNVRQEAARLLEDRYRKTGDVPGLARALEAVLEIAETVKERVRRHEELLALYQGELPDPERAFAHLSALVVIDPKSSSHRARLGAVAAQLGAEDRRAVLLAEAAESLTDLPVKIALFRESAALLEEIGNHEGAAASYWRVLRLSDKDPKVTLDVARTLESLLAGLGRHAERCDVIERIVAVERDPKGKRDALALLAQIAFEEVGDPDRAARAWRARLADDPADRVALAGLERVLESAGRYADLVQVLAKRVALSGGSDARADRVRIARILAEKLGDPAAAIDAWRAIRRDLGADEETYAALSALLESESRWRELAELVEEGAKAAPEGDARTGAYRQLGDLRRDRTGEPILALRAYVAAGDFPSTIATLERLSDRDSVLGVAETLLDLCVEAWPGADAARGAAIAAAAQAAVETLVRRYLEDGALLQVVQTQLRGASLPFERALRRKLRRDAAFTSSDRLDNQEQAIRILHELFAEDPSDEISAASVTRFARLLDEAGRHSELAVLWEQQAKVRGESGDRAGAAALWARAAAIWETSLGDVDRAIAVYRQGAALGGESSLEALARIYGERKNHRAAAMALEWLCAQSTREALAARVLTLADTYLALGEWERARVRLERAAATAIDAGAVRVRLAELYRRHGEWEPLCALLVAEAERAPDDKSRLALLREAAALNFTERAEPALAVPLLERAVELDPEEPALRLALSEALRASGRFDEAAAVLRTQIERYGHRRPKDRALVHLYLARVALAAGSRAEALGELDTGAKINPAHPGILYELGRLAMEEGQLARAERTYRALLLVLRKPDGDAGEAPGRAEICLDLSEIAARQGEPDRAAELVESAFEAALDSATDSASLEKALRKTGRYDLLARAIESRLGAAEGPVAAARALSDLVMLESERGAESRTITSRVQGEAGRIFRDLEARQVGDPGAWAAMTSVYEWLGDSTLEAKALEHRVEAELAAGAAVEVEPLLRLSRIRLGDASLRDQGVSLVERALDAGADPDRVWALLLEASAADPRHHGVLRLLERIAREPGRERALVEVVALRAEAGPIDADVVRDAAPVARSLGERKAELAMLRGALAHGASYDAVDGAWLRERLARLLLEDGGVAEAADLLEAAAELAEPEHGRALALEAARLSAGELSDAERAARLYRKLLEGDAADRDAWEPLLELYRARGERERLIALIGATAPYVASTADRGRLRFEEATLMLAEPERTDAAIALLESVVGEDPTMQEAAELLATLLERQGRLGELVTLTATQLDAAKSTGDAVVVESLSLKLAALLERDGRSDEALRAFSGVLDWNPTSREALRAVVRLEDVAGVPQASLADAVERLLAVEEGEARGALARRLVALRSDEGDAAGLDRALEAACAANPVDADLRERLVARCLERDDWAAAARVLQRAAEADTIDVALLLRAVEAYERGGELPLAVDALGLAVGRASGDADLHLERARLLTLLGRHDEALADVEAAHAAGGCKITDLTGALEAAIERSEGAIRAAHTLRLADLLESAGETGQAREHLVQLLKLLPKHPEALRRLASLAAAEARWDEAAATYRRLIALEEGAALVDAAMNLADACEHSGHLADARGGLERALETLPDSAELRARLRQLYETTGATRELAHLLLKEGRAETDVAARMTALLRAAALLLERDGDAAEAISVLTEVRKLSPESIQGAVLLARAHAALGKSHDALVALEEVVAAHRGRRSRDLALVHREISNVHLEAGNLTAALEALSKAFDLDMRNGELAMQLGHLALDVDDTETATKAFRSVTMMKLKTPGTLEGASAESKAVAYYHLSRIAQAQGDVRKARLMASKAVSENPNHVEAQALLKELRV